MSMDKGLKIWSVLLGDCASSGRWRCFPEVSSKLNFPVILQMRVTKTRELTSGFFLLPLPKFHEDKSFPSSNLIILRQTQWEFSTYFLLEADAHHNLPAPVCECIFSHCPSQDKSYIGKISRMKQGVKTTSDERHELLLKCWLEQRRILISTRALKHDASTEAPNISTFHVASVKQKQNILSFSFTHWQSS